MSDATKQFLKKAKDIQEQLEAKKEPKKERPEEAEGWLISYADMMTLLCGFFIMMFSMAKMDEPQYEKVREAMSQHFGQEFKSPNSETAKFLTQVIQEGGIEGETTIKSDHAGVSVIFQSTIFFDSLGSDIRSQGSILLKELIQKIKEHQTLTGKEFPVVVEGHTDAKPVTDGPFPSNWELSSARASKVVRLFLEQGFSPEKMIAIGYADTRPLFENRDLNGSWIEENLSKNRRVVIRLLNSDSDSIPISKGMPSSQIPFAPARESEEKSAH